MNIVDDITKFIFVENDPDNVDIIFIAGTSGPEPSIKAAELWLQGYSTYVLPSGKYGIKRGEFYLSDSLKALYTEDYSTEWEFMRDVLMKEGVPSNAILKEDEAMYTYENAFKSREVTDKYNLTINKAIICCQAFHARRCLMYYQWAFPTTEFLLYPAQTKGINRNNWFATDYGVERVMGELMRCGSQLKDSISFFRNLK